MAGYQKLNVLLKEELDQLQEEGKLFDRDAFLKEIEAAGDDKEKLMAIYDKLMNLPDDKNFKYVEPIELDDIFAACESDFEKVTIPTGDDLFDKFHGAWLGRCIGCAMGQPVELWHSDGIRKWFEGANAWPIRSYVPTHSKAEEGENPIKLNCTQATTEEITSMPTDDDIRYTVLGLKLTKEKGSKFDTWDVGYHWINNLPLRYLCTAETQAYLNFANMDDHGVWGKKETAAEDIKGVNTYINPYREWIGAQIRIDAYGYVAAGNPKLAAKMSYVDAALSHYKNGVYGAMLFGAMISLAFGETDIETLVKKALDYVPKKSRLYEAIVRAIEIGKESKTEEDVIATINKEYGNINYVHTINNAVICVASIIFSKGDFATALGLSVMCGMDTDCNGATVGSVMGAFCGAKNVPANLKDPLNDTLRSSLPDYHPIAITDVAKQTMETYEKILKED